MESLRVTLCRCTPGLCGNTGRKWHLGVRENCRKTFTQKYHSYVLAVERSVNGEMYDDAPVREENLFSRKLSKFSTIINLDAEQRVFPPCHFRISFNLSREISDKFVSSSDCCTGNFRIRKMFNFSLDRFNTYA